MSFFDEDDDELPPTAVRTAQTEVRRRPQPRRPQRAGGPVDHQSIVTRRLIAAGAAVLALVVIVLVVNGCVRRGKQQALESYNQDVSRIAQTSDQQVSRPLFANLVGAGSKPALEVGGKVDELRRAEQEQAEQAERMKVPGEMASAQRALLTALHLRVEGLTKLASQVRTALGGQAAQMAPKIAGDMEIFLASDVLWSQRVAPLISEALAGGGVQGQSVQGSRFVPNTGWLEPKTVLARLTGQSAALGGPVAPGTHGDTLLGVSVGTNKLAPSETGTLNHVSGGSNPTFTVTFEDSGSNPETDVKVDVAVTSEGRTLTASHIVNRTEPGKTVNVDIPVTGVKLGAAARVKVYVEPVPGETETENNKATYLAIFSQ